MAYHDAASRSELATFLPIRSWSITEGDDGANTSQASPLRMRSASCLDTPDVRLMVTPAFFISKAFFSSRIGPASESA
jgi:hypothetical protein